MKDVNENRVNSGKAKTRNFTRENHRWTANLTGDISGTLMTYMRRKAKERNLVWELSPEYLWDIFLQQNGKCALSGVDIKISSKINSQHNIDRSNHSASLDRIDNSKPYIEGNVQWIHKTLNAMRRQYSVEEFVWWCSKVSSYANPEPSTVKDIEVAVKVQRLTGEESTNNPDTSARLRPATSSEDEIV